MRKLLWLLVIPLVLLSFRLSWNQDPWERSLEKLGEIEGLVQKNYFQNPARDEMIYSSIRGMLLTLDPHSYFLDPQSFARMREDQTGKYAGLGIQIQKQEDRLVVIAPIEGTPAWRLGIQAGDIITHIDGQSTKPISSFEAMQRLRGKRGTPVTVTLTREGLDKPFDLTIDREEITLYSVPYGFLLDKDTGYIFIRNFAENTTREFEDKIKPLAGLGIKKLILDLRLNAGGPLFQAIEISDEFLPRGAMIVSLQGRRPEYNRQFRALRDGQYEGLPLVVLVDEGSASSSEILAGAIMDNDRGYVVGEVSFGKGLVQTIYPLGPNMAVALTTAKYLTPSGRSIQKDYTHLDDYLLARNTDPQKHEIRYTAHGRKVLGQGGITPDFEVRTSIKPVTLELMSKGAYFGYARKFAAHQTPLSAGLLLPGEQPSAARNGPALDRDFRAGESLLADFQAVLKSLRVKYAQDKFEEAKSEIRRELDRELHAALWGPEEGQRVYRLSDPVVLKALEVMPRTASLASSPGTESK
jgi:carboxyl-terminal processing protease